MIVCLASIENSVICQNVAEQVPFVLSSYYYLKGNSYMIDKIKIPKLFMLDSGAFSFMNSLNKNVDFDQYLDEYADFINKHGIDLFFELDIDCVVGYEKVKEYRKILETKTNKRCIPVWHKSRGIDDFIDTCKSYDYIAIGGIVTKEITQAEYKYFPRLIEIAHKHGCKVHGLGFTSMKYLNSIKFDSVDSSSWNSAGRFGIIYQYKNGKVHGHRKDNHRIVDYKATDIWNVKEWVKFQNYAYHWL